MKHNSTHGVMAAPASLEIIGWQWRRIGQPWPEKLLNFEPSVTTADSEKRAIYAGPTITYGVMGTHPLQTPCKHCGAKQGEEHSVTCPHGVPPTEAQPKE